VQNSRLPASLSTHHEYNEAIPNSLVGIRTPHKTAMTESQVGQWLHRKSTPQFPQPHRRSKGIQRDSPPY